MQSQTSVNYTQTLADFVVDKTYDDLPADVVERVKRLILDTLGCAVGGYDHGPQQVVLEVARELGGKPEATVMVSGERLSAPAAAFINADIANAIDADETLFSAMHTGSVIVMSALAAGERNKATGKDLITAVALAYDVSVRIGLSMVIAEVKDDQIVRSHAHGLGFATIGCALAAGKLFKLSRDQMADAMGIAGVFAPSPVAAKLGGEPRVSTLKVNPKMIIAHSAMLAAIFAEKGYSGSKTILDGDHGFWSFQGAMASKWEMLTENLGSQWWIMQSAVKPYPACRFIHHSLDLFYNIVKEQKLGFDDIEAVAVRISPARKRLHALPELERDYSDPSTVINLQFNTPYLMALAALGIPPGPEWYKESWLTDNRVRNFVKKVTMQPLEAGVTEEIRAIKEEHTGRGKTFPTSISVKARGKTFDAQTDYARGDPYFPETYVTNDALKDKFRTFCKAQLSSDQIEKAIQMVFNLEQLDSVTKLAAMMTK